MTVTPRDRVRPTCAQARRVQGTYKTKQNDGRMCGETSRMRECLSPQVEAQGLDMLGSDVSRRWRARREQGRQVGVAHVFLCADVSEKFGKGGLCIKTRREQQGSGPSC